MGVLLKLISLVDLNEQQSFSKFRLWHPIGAFMMFILSSFLVMYIPNWVLFGAAAIFAIVSTVLAVYLYRTQIAKFRSVVAEPLEDESELKNESIELKKEEVELKNE